MIWKRFVTDDFAIVIPKIRKSDPNLQYAVRLVSVKPWESMPLHDLSVMPAKRICTHIHISLFPVFCLNTPHWDAPRIQSDSGFPPSWNINALSFVMQLYDATTASTRANDRFRRYTIAVHTLYFSSPMFCYFYTTVVQNNRDPSRNSCLQ